MNDLFILAADYIHGKSVYPPLRRIFNLLFNISITSFIYEKFYGQYEWISLNNYKYILDFFIKGEFFIPFSIFAVVVFLTSSISLIIFTSINHFSTLIITRKIIKYEVLKDDIEEPLQGISKASVIVVPIKLTKEKMIDLYNELKPHLTDDFINDIKTATEEPKKILESNFHFFFRMVLAISIYFITLHNFGGFLFSIIIIISIIMMYVMLLSYRLLDLFPVLVRKFHEEAEKYIISNQNRSEEKKSTAK